ncbi:glycosyltransferase [Microbacterium enclense]|uniref:glycosyltransferase n=1 Tax=Microbacterium enclense TaxID=993073 RepID=UPI003F818C29
MKVLQVVNTLDSKDGGPARNSFELNQALNSITRSTAQLWSFDGDAPSSTPAADMAQGRVLVGPSPIFKGSLTRLLRAVRGHDIVVIHGFYLWWVPVVLLLARSARKPVVIMPHGAISKYELRKSTAKKHLFDHVVRFTAPPNLSFAVGSSAEASDVATVRPSDRVDVVGVGTRLSDEPRRVRQDDGVAIQLLSVSRIAPKKRVDLMIDATAELKVRGVAAQLTVAGDGDPGLRARLEEQARSLDIADRVSFVGHVGPEEKAQLFRSSDIFLLPSEDENFGIGLAEALSRGLPAVVSDRVAAADAVSPAAVQRLTHPSGATIADAVARWVPRDVWVAASAAAWTESRDAFDWNRVAHRWLSVLNARLLGHAPRQDPPAASEVVYVSTSYPSFSETFVSAEMDALEREGWRVSAYSLRKPPKSLPVTIPYVRRPLSTFELLPWVAVGLVLRWTRWRNTPRLRQEGSARGLARSLYLDAHGARLMIALRGRAGVAGIHAHFLAQPAEVALLAAGARPVAVTAHAADASVTDTSDNRRFVELLSGLRFASRAVEATYETLGVSRPSTVLPCVATLPPARPAWSPSPDRVRVITVARLVETKGYRRMMALIESASARDLVEWTIVGDGAMRAEIEVWRRSAEGPRLRVSMTGALPQRKTLDLLAQSDVFLLLPESSGDTLTKGDGLPVALMEAMACGVPIVTSGAGAIPELVRHGVTGTLIDVVGEDGAVDAIWQAGRTEQAGSLVAAGISLINREFSPTNTASSLSSWLSELFHGCSAPNGGAAR